MEQPVKFTKNALGQNVLSEDTFTGNFFDYSTNLLGALFKVCDHLQIRQVGAGAAPWEGGDTPLAREEHVSADFWEVVESYPACFKVKAFHGMPIPYSRQFDGQSGLATFLSTWDKKAVETAADIWSGKGRKYDFEAEVRLEHHPTHLNYWHTAVDIYPEKTAHDYLASPKGAWGKALNNSLILLLRESFTDKEVDYTISSAYYTIS